MSSSRNARVAVHHIDCVQGMSALEPESANLFVADPPYNLDRKYDTYHDDRPADEYLAWTSAWLDEAARVLHRHGSMWIFSAREFVSEIDVMAKAKGFHQRGHLIWAFTFGVNCPRNFTRSHAHMLYYTKSKTRFTFNQSEPMIRVPSARQLIYKDKRANPAGRLPDDVWVLRGDELQELFAGQADVWMASRVCGTFKEKIPGLDNQLPRQVVDRIVLSCSNEGDLVIDPFLGSGTTAVSAASFNRQFIGYDVSEIAVNKTIDRLSELGL